MVPYCIVYINKQCVYLFQLQTLTRIRQRKNILMVIIGDFIPCCNQTLSTHVNWRVIDDFNITTVLHCIDHMVASCDET